jgi:microcystin-dependent protein
MPTPTDNYAFDLPVDGGDDNVWGDLINGNWTALDTLLQDVEDRLAEVEAKYRIPVDGLFFSAVAINPATLLGYGTWTAYAAGRAIVGVGNNGESTWAGGDQRGSETHTLTEAQMPEHNHSVDPPSTSTSSNGAHTHGNVPLLQGDSDRGTGSSSFSIDSVGSTASNGAHTHTVDIAEFDSGNAGSGSPHNNIQPSIAVYVWRRTA